MDRFGQLRVEIRSFAPIFLGEITWFDFSEPRHPIAAGLEFKGVEHPNKSLLPEEIVKVIAEHCTAQVADPRTGIPTFGFVLWPPNIVGPILCKRIASLEVAICRAL